MVYCPNHCKCIKFASGSSSYSEFVNQCCCKNTCCEQGDFICERDYVALKKICNKIFKDFIRSRCRENYTLFEGGNCVNIRIHGSGFRGLENNFKAYRYGQGTNKFHSSHRKIDEENTTRRGIRGEGEDNESDEEKIVYGQAKEKLHKKVDSAKRKNRNDLTSVIEPTESYNRKTANGERYLNGRAVEGKKKDRLKNREQSKIQHNYNEDSDDDSRSDRDSSKRNHKRADIGYAAREGNKRISRKYSNKHNDEVTDSSGEKDYSKRNHKRADIENAAREANKRISRRYSNNHIEEVTAGNQRQSRGKTKAVENDHTINDLRNKVRRGQKLGPDEDPRVSKTRKSRTLAHQHKKIKFSRADEVKPCDYLRAQLEQRELGKLCCCPQSNQCISRAYNSEFCAERYCPNVTSSCVSETFKC